MKTHVSIHFPIYFPSVDFQSKDSNESDLWQSSLNVPSLFTNILLYPGAAGVDQPLVGEGEPANLHGAPSTVLQLNMTRCHMKAKLEICLKTHHPILNQSSNWDWCEVYELKQRKRHELRYVLRHIIQVWFVLGLTLKSIWTSNNHYLVHKSSHRREGLSLDLSGDANSWENLILLWALTKNWA